MIGCLNKSDLYGKGNPVKLKLELVKKKPSLIWGIFGHFYGLDSAHVFVCVQTCPRSALVFVLVLVCRKWLTFNRTPRPAPENIKAKLAVPYRLPDVKSCCYLSRGHKEVDKLVQSHTAHELKNHNVLQLCLVPKPKHFTKICSHFAFMKQLLSSLWVSQGNPAKLPVIFCEELE